MTNIERLIKNVQYKISSPFGYRIHPFTKKPEGHNGTDIATYHKKVPCYAVTDGIIRKTLQDRFGANVVYVEFPKLNHYGMYYHLDRIDVKVGQKVTKDTQIGIVGTTGQSTGVHLHFSWIKSNSNAMRYYKADYEDFEKYSFPQEHSENYINVQQKYGFDDNTMNYLEDYEYAESLFGKMLLPKEQQTYQLNTITFLLKYKFGKEIFEKLYR